MLVTSLLLRGPGNKDSGDKDSGDKSSCTLYIPKGLMLHHLLYKINKNQRMKDKNKSTLSTTHTVISFHQHRHHLHWEEARADYLKQQNYVTRILPVTAKQAAIFRHAVSCVYVANLDACSSYCIHRFYTCKAFLMCVHVNVSFDRLNSRNDDHILRIHKRMAFRLKMKRLLQYSTENLVVPGKIRHYSLERFF